MDIIFLIFNFTSFILQKYNERVILLMKAVLLFEVRDAPKTTFGEGVKMKNFPTKIYNFTNLFFRKIKSRALNYIM